MTVQDAAGEITDKENEVQDGSDGLESSLHAADGDDGEGGEDDSGNGETERNVDGADAADTALVELVVEPGEGAQEDDCECELEEADSPDAELADTRADTHFSGCFLKS